jgi:hypothetical protein
MMTFSRNWAPPSPPTGAPSRPSFIMSTIRSTSWPRFC